MNEKLAKKFGSVLRHHRELLNLSQEKLAFEVELDRTFISMLERGVLQPTLDTIFRLEKTLRVATSKLIQMIE